MKVIKDLFIIGRGTLELFHLYNPADFMVFCFHLHPFHTWVKQLVGVGISLVFFLTSTVNACGGEVQRLSIITTPFMMHTSTFVGSAFLKLDCIFLCKYMPTLLKPKALFSLVRITPLFWQAHQYFHFAVGRSFLRWLLTLNIITSRLNSPLFKSFTSKGFCVFTIISSSFI